MIQSQGKIWQTDGAEQHQEYSQNQLPFRFRVQLSKLFWVVQLPEVIGVVDVIGEGLQDSFNAVIWQDVGLHPLGLWRLFLGDLLYLLFDLLWGLSCIFSGVSQWNSLIRVNNNWQVETG